MQYALQSPNMTWIWQGYTVVIARTWILHIRSEALDMIRNDTLAIMEFLGIIDYA